MNNQETSLICNYYQQNLNKIIALQTQKWCSLKYYTRKTNKKRLKKCLSNLRKNFFEQRQLMLYWFLENNSLKRKKTIWMKPRSSDWWHRIVENTFLDEDFLENFRTTKQVFNYICSELNSELEPSLNAVREPVPANKIVAISLYKLASCAEYRVVANQFGVHTVTARKCLIKFVAAVVKILLPKFIQFPKEEKARQLAKSFEKISNMPNIIGAIDGCHIPIKAPNVGYSEFINRKGWTSVVLQGIVDSNYMFRSITCKHPGSSHDASVLKDSNFYKNVQNIMPKERLSVDNLDFPLCLVGDPAYPLTDWLIKNYSASDSPEQQSFNVYSNKARIVVENAFGRLKARWRMISKKVETNYKFVPDVVAVCCTLHNIVEHHKCAFRPSWTDELHSVEINYPQPVSREYLTQPSGNTSIRDLLCNYITKYPILSSKL